MLDSADWVALFLGAIKAGIVPVALNTLLTAKDYEYQLERQPRAGALLFGATAKNLEGMQAKCPNLKYVVTEAQLKDLQRAPGRRRKRRPAAARRNVFLALLLGVHRRTERHGAPA